MEKEHDIKFFTQIPSWVDELDDISDFQARLLGYVYTFENVSGVAFPSNGNIAKHFHKKPNSVQVALSDLYNKGYMRREVIRKADDKTIERRYLYTVPPVEKNQLPYVKKINYPTLKKSTENRLLNKLNNNTVQKEFGRDDFEKLWKLYPRKEGKKVAYKAYQKAIKNGTTNKQIQDGIVAYKKMLASTERPADKVKMGSTWFNENCWEDEYNFGTSKQTVNYQIDEINRLEKELQNDQLEAAERIFMTNKLAELKGRE